MTTKKPTLVEGTSEGIPVPVTIKEERPQDRRQWLLKQYTAAEVLTILAAITTLIIAFGVGTVNIIVALKTTTVVEQTLQTTQKVSAQVEQVHDTTNSNLSAVKAELANSVAQITILREMVQDLRAERAKVVETK